MGLQVYRNIGLSRDISHASSNLLIMRNVQENIHALPTCALSKRVSLYRCGCRSRKGHEKGVLRFSKDISSSFL